MNKRILLFIVASMILVASIGFASCGVSEAVRMFLSGTTNIQTNLDANRNLMFFWVAEVTPGTGATLYNSTAGVGQDKGTCPNSGVGAAFTWSATRLANAVNTNWFNPGWDGCPASAGAYGVCVVMDQVNEGAATHAGYIAIGADTSDTNRFFFSEITNGYNDYGYAAGTCARLVAMPVISITSFTEVDADTISLGLSWSKPVFGTDANSAYFKLAEGDPDNSVNAAIQSYQVLFNEVATGVPPTTSVGTSWTAISSADGGVVDYDPASATATATVTINWSGGAGREIYLSLGLLLRDLANANGTLAQYVGGNSLPINPTPTTFSSFTGKYATLQQINMNWVTASETDAMGFNLYRSIDGANWTKVNSAIIPAKGVGGAGASYAYTDNLPKQRVYQPFKYKVEEMSNTGTRIAETTANVTK